MARVHGSFPMEAIQAFELVETSSIPRGTHPAPGTKRRWQELGESILNAPDGQSVHLIIQSGVDPETLRQGVQAEFKRFGRKVSIRSVVEPDGRTSVYLTAVRSPGGTDQNGTE